MGTALIVAAVVLAVWNEHTYRRGMCRIGIPTVEDPARSASAGGFGPEWNPLIARTEETNR